MKFHAIACIAFLTLTGAGCASALRPYAQTIWQTVQLNSFSVSVPYSKDWKTSGNGLSVYEADSRSEGSQVIRFGKPADAGTYITREYFLFRDSRNSQPEQASLEYLQSHLSCVDGFKSRIIEVGGRTGVEHHMGGAKGCSTGFVFNQGEYTYYLYRVPDIGKDSPPIDEEMRTIIQSIKPHVTASVR
jgi:hypothetical protein